MDELDVRRQRAAHNQALFREVNERIAALSTRFTTDVPLDAYICECLDMSCAEVVQLSQDEYNRLREDSNRFFVLPGHEDLSVEAVVDANDRYVVVRKLGVGAEIANQYA